MNGDQRNNQNNQNNEYLSDFQSHIEGQQPRQNGGGIAEQAFQVITEAQSVNATEEKGKEINGREAGGKTEFFDKNITHCGDYDGNGDEEFNPVTRYVDERKNAHGEGDGMADGKGSNENQ